MVISKICTSASRVRMPWTSVQILLTLAKTVPY